MQAFAPNAGASFGAMTLFAGTQFLAATACPLAATGRIAVQAPQPVQSAPDQSAPGQTTPAQTAPVQAALCQSAPVQSALDQSACGKASLVRRHQDSAACPAFRARFGKADLGSQPLALMLNRAAGATLAVLALFAASLPGIALASPQAGGHGAHVLAESGPALAKANESAVQDALREASRQSQTRKAEASAGGHGDAGGSRPDPAGDKARQAAQAPARTADQALADRSGQPAGTPAPASGRSRAGTRADAGADAGAETRTTLPASRASRAPQPSLERLLRLSPDARGRSSARQNLRLKVVADAGATLAFQQGFQARYAELMAACERRARDFDRIFDFQKLILEGRVLPPVIRWTGRSVVVDSPSSATAADATYVIERPARIVASAPGWREWLLVDAEPFEPDQALLPRTGEERRAWQEAVREGWTAGRVHAGDIFEAAMARLEADYRGMLRFRMLADRGLASAPVLAEGQVALSVMGRRLSLNETTIRITVPASFEAAERQPLAGRPGHAPLLPE